MNLNEIKEALAEGADKKSSNVLEAMKSLEEIVDAYLSSINYNYEEMPRIELFRQSTDSRLEEARKKLASMTDERVSILDGVKYLHNQMYELINRSERGHLREFYLDERGLFHLEVNLYLYPGFADNAENKNRMKERYAARIQEMKNEGYIIYSSRNAGGDYYADCDENRTRLVSHFGKMGAMGIEFQSRSEKLSEMSFVMYPEAVLNAIHGKSEADEKSNSPVITAFEVKDIRKQLAELRDCVGCTSEGIVKSAIGGSVIEHCVSEISEILGYEGVIYKRVKARHAVERAKNEEIHEIERQIGERIQPETLKTLPEKLYTAMQYHILTKTSFDIRDFVITQYGTINFKLRWLAEEPRYIFFDRDIEMDDEELAKTFMVDGSRENSDIRMCDTEKNFLSLAMKLREIIPGFDILSTSSRHEYGLRYFQELTCSVSNIVAVVNLLDH